MKMVEYRFTFLTVVLEKMSMWFNYPRRPYGVMVSKHPDNAKYVVLAFCNQPKSQNDSYADIVDYVLLPLDDARNLAERIRITADQVETFGG
jgi:hypothetical protein